MLVLLPADGFTDPFTFSGDKVLIQEVLFDAVVTAPLEAYWTSLVLNKSEFVFFFSPQLNALRVRCFVPIEPLIVSLGNHTGTRIKGWRSPTSAPGRACPGLTCLWFPMSSQTSKCADSSGSNNALAAPASASRPLLCPPHIQRLPDGGGQGGRVQRRPLPAVVQESGGAGPRNLRLLAAFQHRLAVNVNTEHTRGVRSRATFEGR